MPTPAPCGSSGAPTWAALSGHPVATEVWTTSPRCRTCGSARQADLVVVAPATADLLARAAARAGRRPAHQHPAHRPLPGACSRPRCTPRCGSTRPRRRTSPRCAPRRRRDRARRRPADRADTGPGRLPDPGEIFAVALLGARRGAAELDLAGRRVSCQRGRHPRAARPGALPRQPVLRPAGLRARPTAAARGAEVTLVAANVALPDPAGAKVIRVGIAPASCASAVHAGGGRRRRGGDGRGGGRLPAGRHGERQDQEDDGHAPEPLHLIENPDMLAELGRAPQPAGHSPSSASPPRPTTLPRLERPGQAGRARAATCWSSTRSAPDTASATADNAAVISAADGAADRGAARAARPRWPTSVWDARAPTTGCRVGT